MSASDWSDDRWDEFPKTEDRRMSIGKGDHATTNYSIAIRGPIVPGSVFIRVMPPDAVSQLGALAGHVKPEMACCDVSEDGALHGDCSGSVSYVTGCVQIAWKHAPAQDSDIVLTYKRRLHKLHEAKVRIKLDGKKRWATLRELWCALNNL